VTLVLNGRSTELVKDDTSGTTLLPEDQDLAWAGHPLRQDPDSYEAGLHLSGSIPWLKLLTPHT
jgi:hypothetical protein